MSEGSPSSESPAVATAPDTRTSAADGAPLVVAQNLAKHYGPVRAVDDVSFQVERGEILGFLGPNGAGKSTTIKMMTGYLSPDAGDVKVHGHDVETDALEARKRMGYLPEALPLYPEMRVEEYLKFIADVRKLGGRAKERIDYVVDRLGLARMRRRPTGSLSKGYRQRVGLAQAILHDPDVLILDEPTNGLDPHQIIEIRELLTELAKSKAIIFSTHILQEISAICSRIMIIRDGKLIANGTPDELAASAGSDTWEVIAAGSNEISDGKFDGLGLGRVSRREIVGAAERIRFDGAPAEIDVADVASKIRDLGARVEEVRRSERSLERVYLALTEGGAA